MTAMVNQLVGSILLFHVLSLEIYIHLEGVFVDNAMELINMPPWSEERVQEFFELTIKQALSYGLTSIHDADTKLDHIHFFKKYVSYLFCCQSHLTYWNDRMAEEGKLPVDHLVIQMR